MNKTYLAAWIACCTLFTGIAFADPAVQLPTGDAAWSVAITYAPTPPPDPAKKAPPVLKKAQKIEVTQVGDVRRVRVTWTDGQSTEEWSVPNLPVVFKEYPNGSVASIQKGGLEVKFDNFNMPYDISAFSWLTPATLQSQTPVSYQGKQCLHYAGGASLPDVGRQSGGTSTRFKREAWIDSKTLLPVALTTETSLCIFTFQDNPPVGPLDPPPKFKQEIAYYKRVMGFP